MDVMQRRWVTMGRLLFRLSFFAFLSYGFLYFSYKYYIPDYGGNDFFEYYPMYLHPFNYQVAESSWVYRQLTALAVHVVWKMGIFYDTTIAFSTPGYDKHVFFAAIFTNYIALLITALVVTYSAQKICAEKSEAWSILAGILCFFCFFVQQGVLTGLTEGISWLLVAVGFLGYVSRSLVPIAVVLCLSVIQRETIPFVFGALGAVGLIYHNEARHFNGLVLLLSLSSFLIYILVRVVLIPIPGNESQLRLLDIMSSLGSWQQKITKDFIFQALLSQNLLILLAGTATALTLARRLGSAAEPLPIPTSEISVFIAALTLVLIGFAADIGNNIGRILSILTPLAAPLLVRNLAGIFASRSTDRISGFPREDTKNTS
jgi:hypothetical protein